MRNRLLVMKMLQGSVDLMGSLGSNDSDLIHVEKRGQFQALEGCERLFPIPASRLTKLQCLSLQYR